MLDNEIMEYCKNLGWNLFAETQYIKDFLLGKLRNTLQPYWSTTWNGSEITDQIYISDLASVYNRDKLKELGITHVLTTVLGITPMFPDDFVYMNIPAQDIPSQDLEKYFREGCDFIDTALAKNGKVLVHCSYGVSRSASMVIAYLIRATGKPYDDVLTYVKARRPVVQPNEGFESQLRLWETQVLFSEQNSNLIQLIDNKAAITPSVDQPDDI